MSGLHGLSGVLMALLRRQTTGKGDYIDVSMHEALMASCANVVGTAFTEGKQPDVKQQRTTGGSAFYRVYDTSDGRQLVLAGQEMKFIRNLLGALGKPEMVALCEWPGPHQKPVMDFLAATFREPSRWRTGWRGSPRSISATARSTRCPRRSSIPTS